MDETGFYFWPKPRGATALKCPALWAAGEWAGPPSVHLLPRQRAGGGANPCGSGTSYPNPQTTAHPQGPEVSRGSNSDPKSDLHPGLDGPCQSSGRTRGSGEDGVAQGPILESLAWRFPLGPPEVFGKCAFNQKRGLNTSIVYNPGGSVFFVPGLWGRRGHCSLFILHYFNVFLFALLKLILMTSLGVGDFFNFRNSCRCPAVVGEMPTKTHNSDTHSHTHTHFHTHTHTLSHTHFHTHTH